MSELKDREDRIIREGEAAREALRLTPGQAKTLAKGQIPVGEPGWRREPVHSYLSTACHHELHDECRRSCKFCSAGCTCSCHEAHP